LSTAGRAHLRERVAIEHSLAHLGHWQGPRARYCGRRKNLFELRWAAIVHNLHVLRRRFLAQRRLVSYLLDRCSSPLEQRAALWGTKPEDAMALPDASLLSATPGQPGRLTCSTGMSDSVAPKVCQSDQSGATPHD
jgi:hypothetical protein